MVLDRKYISEIRIDKKIPEDSFLNDIPAVRYLQGGNILKFDSNITFLVGDNGTGKSTIIEAVAVASRFNPEGGTLNSMFSTYNTHSDLNKYITVARQNHPKKGYFLRAETLYNLATYRLDVFEKEIEKGEMQDYHRISHGEAFLSSVQELYGNGLYIFDEPEAALSPSKQLTFMCEINRLLNRNSQFIISTHSPILMAFPGAAIYQLTDKGIEKISYTETEHYRITKLFLDCPERMFKHLFEE